MNYNVVCEGPSSLLVRPEDLLEGTTIAVNCAIRLPHEFDIWATGDSPKNLESYAEFYLEPDTAILTLDIHLPLWIEMGYGESDGSGGGTFERTVYSMTPYFLNPFDTGRGIMPDEDIIELASIDPQLTRWAVDAKGRKTLVPTIFFVLEWIARQGNAKEITIYGADMEGTHSPLHPEYEYSPEMTQAQEWRWRAERSALAQVAKILKRRGVKLSRWKVDEPQPAS